MILDTTSHRKQAPRPVAGRRQQGGDKVEGDSRNRLPRYPIGLQFVKHFEGHGSFEGRIARITAFDGQHYKVFYPGDGNEEELSEWEFESNEDVEFTEIPV